jgi:hypothetical protein
VLTVFSPAVLQRVAGKDASKQFWKYHNEGILKKYKSQLQIGSLGGKPAAALGTTSAPLPLVQESPRKSNQAEGASAKPEALDPYGDLIPFGDPAWYQGVSSRPTWT